jgi:hypothetical protein
VRASPSPPPDRRGIMAAPTPHGEPVVRKLLRISRLPRILLNATAAVLCVLIVAMWVASYFRGDIICYSTGIRPRSTPDGDFEQREFHVGYYVEGQLGLSSHAAYAWDKDDLEFSPRFQWSGFGGKPLRDWAWSHYWFNWGHARQGGGSIFGGGVVTYEDSYVEIPFWALLLPPLLWTVFVVRAYRRKRKLARLGLCAKCGYDLRASTPGGRCPECGTPIPADLQRQSIAVR